MSVQEVYAEDTLLDLVEAEEVWCSTNMAWTTPQYSRRKVDSSGEILAHWHERSLELEAEELDDALSVINNWRSSHSYPLHILKKTMHYRARNVEGTCLSAQRLKRLSSVATKLRRNKNMKLSQMQDIGGCRAVMGEPDPV